jgi:hypothetical protein
MSWPALAKPALKEATKKSLADAIVDRFNHLLTDSDSWNTGGIRQCRSAVRSRLDRIQRQQECQLQNRRIQLRR